jgi:hypothetical protein
VLFNCHSGCSGEEIVAALGLSMSDLFPAKASRLNQLPKKDEKVYDTPDAAVEWLVAKHGKPAAVHAYQTMDGAEVFRVYRFEFKDPKTGVWTKTFRPVHQTEEGWVCRKPKGQVPLYRLPEVNKAERVFVCEGEKAADRLRQLGLTATTSAFGAGAAGKTDWSPLSGKDVIIMPDHDEPGEKYLKEVLKRLTARRPRPSIKILRLAEHWQTGGDPPRGADAVEFVEQGMPSEWSDQDRLECIEHCVNATKFEEDERPRLTRASESDDEGEIDQEDDSEVTASKDADRDKKKSQVEQVLEIAGAAQLFRTPDGKPYASIKVKSRTEHLRLKSKHIEHWLNREYRLQHGKPPSNESLQSAIRALESEAMIEGPIKSVFVRVAEHDGRCYIDLVNDAGQVIQIDQSGWRVIDDAPVAFRRSYAMKPLPEPKPEGSLDRLRPLVNLGSDDDWLLFLSTLTFYLRPFGPYPIMILTGEQGCAKSTTARIARQLVDPNAVALKGDFKDERSLIISTSNAWLLVIDNVSRVPSWLSDALCRIATGGGFSTRQLFADDAEALFDVQWPVILNGITEFVERPDLADRSVFFHLPVIPEENRREESELVKEIAEALPEVFASLLDLYVAALKLLPHIRLHRKPRMADFAVWGEAVSQALGKQPGDFMRAYSANRKHATLQIVDEAPVAIYVRAFMENRSEWEGSASELLEELTALLGEKRRELRDWPTSGRKLSGALRRLAPPLRSNGIDLDFGQRTGAGRNKRLIRIRCTVISEHDQPPEQPAQPAAGSEVSAPGDPEKPVCERSAPGEASTASIAAQSGSLLSFLASQPMGGADGADDALPTSCSPDVITEVF